MCITACGFQKLRHEQLRPGSYDRFSFDVYDGDKLPENKKSIAFRVLLQPQDKTFNELEIEELSNKIIDEISKSFDASIRN